MSKDADRLHSGFRSDISPVSSNFDHSPVEPVPLDEVIEDTLRMLRHEFEGQRIQISQSHTASQLAVIDRQELQQVLVNLITNAVEAFKQKAKLDGAVHSSGNLSRSALINIRTFDADAATVCLSVSDNGCGIETDHLERVFDPFFTSGKVQGTGLGLSVSYGIVRRTGGDIRVQSQLGEGSKFEVLLPAVASAGDSAERVTRSSV